MDIHHTDLRLALGLVMAYRFPLDFSSRLRTPPLPVTHARLATGLHTGRGSFVGTTQDMRLQVARPVTT